VKKAVGILEMKVPNFAKGRLLSAGRPNQT
jgi:hypothetical protein